MLNYDGRCLECDEYQRPQIQGKYCGPDACTVFQYQLKNGKCSACPAYEKKSDDERSCVDANCNS